MAQKIIYSPTRTDTSAVFADEVIELAKAHGIKLTLQDSTKSEPISEMAKTLLGVTFENIQSLRSAQTVMRTVMADMEIKITDLQAGEEFYKSKCEQMYIGLDDSSLINACVDVMEQSVSPNHPNASLSSQDRMEMYSATREMLRLFFDTIFA